MFTEWMATAYKTVTSNYSEHPSQRVLNEKRMEMIQNNYINNPLKEKEDVVLTGEYGPSYWF
jgi:hypothetical protein